MQIFNNSTLPVGGGRGRGRRRGDKYNDNGDRQIEQMKYMNYVVHAMKKQC
jgi:hypothetical protein